MFDSKSEPIIGDILWRSRDALLLALVDVALADRARGVEVVGADLLEPKPLNQRAVCL